jgi:hypothetical protein
VETLGKKMPRTKINLIWGEESTLGQNPHPLTYAELLNSGCRSILMKWAVKMPRAVSWRILFHRVELIQKISASSYYSLKLLKLFTG